METTRLWVEHDGAQTRYTVPAVPVVFSSFTMPVSVCWANPSVGHAACWASDFALPQGAQQVERAASGMLEAGTPVVSPAFQTPGLDLMVAAMPRAHESIGSLHQSKSSPNIAGEKWSTYSPVLPRADGCLSAVSSAAALPEDCHIHGADCWVQDPANGFPRDTPRAFCVPSWEAGVRPAWERCVSPTTRTRTASGAAQRDIPGASGVASLLAATNCSQTQGEPWCAACGSPPVAAVSPGVCQICAVAGRLPDVSRVGSLVRNPLAIGAAQYRAAFHALDAAPGVAASSPASSAAPAIALVTDGFTGGIQDASPTTSKLSRAARRREARRRAAGTSQGMRVVKLAESTASEEPQHIAIAANSLHADIARGVDIGEACHTELTSWLAIPGEKRLRALATLRGHFAYLAFKARGCRLAQAALDVAGREERTEFAAELRGGVLRALKSPNANFVLQKLVEVMPPSVVGFVADELSGVVADVAQHQYGCRVLCRLLEHCNQDQAESLVGEILQKLDELCRHRYGNFVMQHIVEHGTCKQRGAVIQGLLADPFGFASHRFASRVVDQVLTTSTSEEKAELRRALVRNASSLTWLACSRYGSHVAQTLLTLSDNEDVRFLLVQSLPVLQNSKYGKRVLAELGHIRVVSRGHGCSSEPTSTEMSANVQPSPA